MYYSNLVSNISPNVKLLFNPGSTNIAESIKEEFLKIIRNSVDIVILNEDEASALSGYSENDAGD